MNTYDPFTLIDRPKAGLFGSIPAASPGTVLVVDRADRELAALQQGEKLTAGELRWGSIRSVYMVNVNQMSIDFEDRLPCLDDIGGFRVSGQITCEVSDPVAIVLRGIHDAARVLLPPLLETLRRSSETFHAEDVEAAERTSLASAREREMSQSRHDSAFLIRNIHLVLRLDDRAAADVRERKESARTSVRQANEAALAREKARLEAERQALIEELEQERLIVQQARQHLESQLVDQQQNFELERAASRARREYEASSELELKKLEFEVLRQKRQAEIDKERVQLDIERAELEAQYERMRLQARLERERLEVEQLALLLNQGEFQRLALQLTRNPEDIEKVNLLLLQQRNVDSQRQFEALSLLIANDGLEGWQVTNQAKSVLTKLLESWSRLDPQVPSAAPQALTSEGETVESEVISVVQGSGPSVETSVGYSSTTRGLAEDFPGDLDESSTSKQA